MNRKTCRCCKEEKDLSNFRLERKTVKGKLYEYLKTRCISCDQEYSREWNLKNNEREKEKKRQHYYKNKEECLTRTRKYSEQNKDKISLRNKKKRESEGYKEKINLYLRERRRNNPIVKLQVVVRNRIRKILKGWSKSASSQQLVGCSWEELRQHIESQFCEGMTWENHGNKGWHIDHRIPLASAKTLEEVEKLCHYTNLQPLWWNENLSKGKKMPD